MFSLSSSHQYYLFTGSTDMRKGFDALSGVVRSQMGRDPLSGEVYIFINRQRNTVKILHWERGGLVIYHKRLESGQFERPYFDEKQNAFQMRWSGLMMMIEGLSMKNVVQSKRFDIGLSKNHIRSQTLNDSVFNR
ncbi:MAG: IS66 family insertion sequence element accessory protein TnpB [Bacteroidales bacterium]